MVVVWTSALNRIRDIHSTVIFQYSVYARITVPLETGAARTYT